MKSVYQAFLKWYPAEYRAVFAQEMMATFEETAEERAPLGGVQRAAFVVSECLSLLAGAARERIRRQTLRSSYLMDVRPAEASNELPAAIQEAQWRVAVALRRMEHAIAHHDFPRARYYSEVEREARAALRASME